MEKRKLGNIEVSEIGIGIGNILRVCDLYSVWSLSPDIRWGMRFRIHLGL